MFFFIKTALIILFIHTIAFNGINISIAENFPKTYIELPKYNLITKPTNYYVIEHKLSAYTSIDYDGFLQTSYFDRSSYK